MFGKKEEGTPPQTSPQGSANQDEEPDASARNGVENGSGGTVAESPSIVTQLRAIGNIDPRDLAQAALGGEASDEVVPTAEGITFFKGARSQQHKKSGSDKSLLATRLERINKGASAKG